MGGKSKDQKKKKKTKGGEGKPKKEKKGKASKTVDAEQFEGTDEEHAAATKIQAVHRGNQVRKASSTDLVRASMPSRDKNPDPESAGSDAKQKPKEKSAHSKKEDKKHIKMSYKMGKKDRGRWSNEYAAGFTKEHKVAATRIQKAFRRFRAWKSAKQRHEDMQQRSMTNKDRLGRLVLWLFNLAGIVVGLAGAWAVWYYLINCPEGWIGGPGTCLNTTPNWILCWVQVAFASLCVVGMRGTSPHRLEWLRAYSFLMLLLVAAEISIVGMFALDDSAAMRGMQDTVYGTVFNSTCQVSEALDGLLNGTIGLVALSTETEPGMSDDVLKELCACIEEGKTQAACMKEHIDKYVDVLVMVFGGVILVQIIMSRLAWQFMSLPSDFGTDDGALTEMKMWLRNNELEVYLKRLMVLGVRSREAIVEMPMSKLTEVGMNATDKRRFLVAQGQSKVEKLDATDHLGLTGWDKLVSGAAMDMSDEMKINVSIMTKTWYFESTVLASVALCMYVLARQSAAFPPSDEEAIVLQSFQIFVTIFFTLEMLLEMVIVASSRKTRSYFSDPWHLLDVLVLIVFWLSLLYPLFRNTCVDVFAKTIGAPGDGNLDGWTDPNFFGREPYGCDDSDPTNPLYDPECKDVDPSTCPGDLDSDPGPCVERDLNRDFLPPQQPAAIAVLRVARVLRPLRTLRLLGDITLVAQCIAGSWHLFRDVIILSALTILLFSMIGISSFAGSLHYTCVTCAEPMLVGGFPSAEGWDTWTVPSSIENEDGTTSSVEWDVGARGPEQLDLSRCAPDNQLVYEGHEWVRAAYATTAEYPGGWDGSVNRDWRNWEFTWDGEYTGDDVPAPTRAGIFPCPTTLKCYSERKTERNNEGIQVGRSPDLTGWEYDKPIMCVEKIKDGKPVYMGVGEDEYGTRSFDHVFQAFYSVFIHMSGDNGMQDLPNALFDADASSVWLAWPLFAVATFMLTVVLLNLFLAICCSVFEDIHASLEQAKATREEARQIKEKMKHLEEEAAKSDGGKSTGLLHTGTPADLILDNLNVDNIDKAIESTFEHATDMADNIKQKVLDNPGIGLNNMDDDRRRMDDMLEEAENQAPAWKKMLIAFTSSKLFEVAVMLGILAYTAIVMGQDVFQKNLSFKENLVLLEFGLFGLFFVEFFLKVLGLGKKVLSFGENRLDLLVLVCSLIGAIGTYSMVHLEQAAQLVDDLEQAAASTLSNNATSGGLGAGAKVVEHDYFLRVIKLLRIMQMFRMTYKYQTMREILGTVFKSASSIAYLVMFVIFILSMFSLIMMHVMGGGCNINFNPGMVDLWNECDGCTQTNETGRVDEFCCTDCEYPDANFESFTIGFLTSFQLMTGEDWSEVMFWYVRYSPRGFYAAPFFMFMWVVVHGILFSLFVAVLLLNFSMAEGDKLPEQQRQYNSHIKAQNKKGKGKSHDLFQTMASERAEQAEGGAFVDSSGDVDQVLQLVKFSEELEDTEKGKAKWKSLFLFDLESPFRMICCKIENHLFFEITIISIILLSCVALAMAKPCVEMDEDDDSNSTDGSGSWEEGTGGAGGEFAACDREDPWTVFADVVRVLVLIIFYTELILRSISRGFLSVSGPSKPYLRRGFDQIDFVIILICTWSEIKITDFDGNDQQYVKMIRSMAPMVSLVRNRGLRSVFYSFRNALPLIAVVSLPILFLMGMMSIVGVDLFGSTQMMQCMPRPGTVWDPELEPTETKLVNGEIYTSYYKDSVVDACGGEMCTVYVAGDDMPSMEIGTGYLNDDELLGTPISERNVTECKELMLAGHPVEWKNPPFSFDHAFGGLLSLCKAATAGVMPIQNVAVNIVGPGQAPEGLAFHAAVLYFVIFHLIFTFFLLNLFIGVMSTSFSKSSGTMVVTNLQRRWVQCNNMIEVFVPQDDENDEDKPIPGDRFYRARLRMFNIVSHRWFHRTTISVIVINCAILLCIHYPVDPLFAELYGMVDIAFLLYYAVEMVMKMVGFGFTNYFNRGWNCFDCFLVTLSLLSVIFGTVSGIESLRVLRSLRLFLIAQQLPGLMSMIDTVLKCLVPAVTIAAIMSIFFYVYAVAGMTLFGDAGFDHDYYNENNNFSTFYSSFRLLFQVQFGQNYMWLTADLVAEGKNEDVVTLYFISFFVINVLINLNLLAVIILDNFAAQNPVAQTIGPMDLWAFTHAWAEQTIGAGCCPSLQKGNGAKQLRRMERQAAGEEVELSASEDEEDEEDEDEDGMISPREAAKGMTAMKKKAAKDAKRPKGVVTLKIDKVVGLPFRNEGGELEKARPYVRLFSKPGGRSHAMHTGVQLKKSGSGADTSLSFDHEEKIFLPPTDRNITFEVIDQVTGTKHGQAFVTAKKLALYKDASDPGRLTVDLTGPLLPISEATEEDLERIRQKAEERLRSPRAGSPTAGASPRKRSPSPGAKSPRARDGSASPKAHSPKARSPKAAPTHFRPIVGQIHLSSILFAEGLSMPKFDFMARFNDNAKFKEGGCGIEGWMWKRSGDLLFPNWERRWMWITIPTVHDPDVEPAVHYFQECEDEPELEERGRHGTLVAHTVPADQIVTVNSKLKWPDGKEHKVSGKDAAKLKECEFQFVRAAHASSHGGNKVQKESTYRFRSMCPEQKSTWVNALKWLQAAAKDPLEQEEARSKDEIVQAILTRAERTDAESAFHDALRAELEGHSLDELRHRDWLEVLKDSRPERMPLPTINKRDMERCQNNPALLPMPFARVRFFLIELHRYQSLGCHRMTREWLLYTAFNLEMCAMQRNTQKSREKDSMRSHIGQYISEIRGLDYMQTLRRLCLLHYEKRHSLMFTQQMEEYQHDLHKVALNLITSAVSGWVFGKMLPKMHEKKWGVRRVKVMYGKVKQAQETRERKKAAEEELRKENEARQADGLPPLEAQQVDDGTSRHDTFPKNAMWRRLPNAHGVAVVGVAAMRLNSLAVLFRAVKKEKPALLIKQEKEEEAEKQRLAALDADELRAEQEAKAEADRKEAARQARKEGSCFKKKKKDGGSKDGTTIVNPFLDEEEDDEEGTGSPLGESLLGGQGDMVVVEQPAPGDGDGAMPAPSLSMLDTKDEYDAPKSESELKGSEPKAKWTNPLDVNDDDDDDDGDAGAAGGEKFEAEIAAATERAYRDVFDPYVNTYKTIGEESVGYLDQVATAQLLEDKYPGVLAASNTTGTKYVKEHFASEDGGMCTDAAAGLSFADYLMWEADNDSLMLGARERKQVYAESNAERWSATHQFSNEEMRGVRAGSQAEKSSVKEFFGSSAGEGAAVVPEKGAGAD